ncbi:MAG: hydrogenase/urease maturation nickel metallochaperone HypA [Nanoarchaeota archaeon]
MHESVIASNIINEANRHGMVKSIYLEIGELAQVPPDELFDCLKGMVKWKINSKIIKAKVECKCGFKGHPNILERGHDSFFIECPKCRKIPKLIDGTQIKIIKVVVE